MCLPILLLLLRPHRCLPAGPPTAEPPIDIENIMRSMLHSVSKAFESPNWLSELTGNSPAALWKKAKLAISSKNPSSLNPLRILPPWSPLIAIFLISLATILIFLAIKRALPRRHSSANAPVHI